MSDGSSQALFPTRRGQKERSFQQSVERENAKGQGNDSAEIEEHLAASRSASIELGDFRTFRTDGIAPPEA